MAELIQKGIEENARVALDQDEYNRRREGLVTRYKTAKNMLDEVEVKIAEKKSRKGLMEKFVTDLAAQEGFLAEFDERLWFSLVDFVTVGKDGTVTFTFKNRTEVKAKNPA